MKKTLNLSLGSLMFSATSILIASAVLANNAVLRSIFSCQAQGLGGAIPSIKVWYQQGTNLSFIPAEETIKKVWLDDPSQVTLDFDGPMCVQFGEENANTADCENSAASVIHLRRIEKLDIPGLPNTDNTLLTVITETNSKKRLYTFRVIYQEGSPEYNTLAVFADPPNFGETPCVRVEE
ncbi:hypothetical protein IQ247_17150 [Plectonema cf. radiosum LEGE 06105]|uniref:Uncharacterized protein n=2 Tax=Plectonema TaxID=1183 RepID=A0A8J7F8Z9_9CYAN|nr:hypothetical protein [Plectonema cf. radiosum LEGE 06105]